MSAHPLRRPLVDPRELRPRRVWYVLGTGVITLGILVGIAGFAVMMVRMLAPPEFEAELRGSGEVTFTLDEGVGRLGLYASPWDADGYSCVLVLPDGQEREFGFPPYSHSVDTLSESWALAGDAETAGAGEYALACDGGADTAFGVTDIQDGERTFLANLMGAFASILGAPLTGLLVGAPILIVTAARRNRHRRRLLGERGRSPYQG
ncbi:hypothetical protein KIK06_25600 [Nocardiopsis sp. EMB25]|uniref:hypothetical protein n=1 Tax=Nocardiopsis sp. EMB25 TaxID=2835867 RepID=UPI0022833A3A|nr:hypothetical protein [Nocardiopsis sp. EMB25]MCY9787261.1 hypothetical protein [Nocardiopsis sp. EMB25]